MNLLRPERRRERVRISPATIVRAVVLSVVAFTAFGVLARASRVLEWVITAGVVAGVLEPAVARLSRHVRRGLAVACVAVLTAGAVAGVSYRVVDGVFRAARAIEREAPRRVAELESSESVGEFVREARLLERVEGLVEDLPVRLFGSTPAGAVRAAVERAVSFLVVAVLTLFLLARGPDLARLAGRLPLPEGRRRALARAVGEGRRRGLGYLRRTVALSLGAGVVAFALGHAVGVPGAAAVGVWAGLWDLVPVVGTLVGFAPVLLLADTSALGLILAGVGLVAYEVLETAVRVRWVHRGTIRLGPFLTALALFAGLEVGGVLGALVSLALVAFGVALVEEAVPALQASPDTPEADGSSSPSAAAR